jgi:hypothetical protein
MAILNPNSTPYQHPWEPNLSDLHTAMEYNAGGRPTLRTQDFNLAVAQGKVPGVTGLSISGYRLSSGTGFLPAWEDGAYVYFSSAQVVRVWSVSASDTNVSVRIDGLDANYVQQTETVVLTNGITGVLSTKEFLRINNLTLTRAPNNVGLIHAGSSDKTITLAYIGTTSNLSAGRSQMTVFTVPAGHTFYLTQSNWYINASQPASYRSWTQRPDGLVNIILNFPILDQYNSLKVVPRPYLEKTDIQWQASIPNNTAVGGQIEGYLISNTYL